MSHKKNNYGEFLFYSLIKDTKNSHPLKKMEYDAAFLLLYSYYEEFYLSYYFIQEKSEYDCIIDFLNDCYPLHTENN